jgi:hypothetical protein
MRTRNDMATPQSALGKALVFLRKILAGAAHCRPHAARYALRCLPLLAGGCAKRARIRHELGKNKARPGQLLGEEADRDALK